MTAAPAPAPIQVPGRRSPRRTREASESSQRRGQSPLLAMTASVVLVTLVMMEIWSPRETTDDSKEYGFRLGRLVFPSQQVTWAKLVGLLLGFVLTTSYFLSSQAQLASAEKMMVHSAEMLVSPLRRSQPKPMANDPDAPTPTGKTTAAWLASRYQSLLHTDHFDGGQNLIGGQCDEIPQLKLRDECKLHAGPVPSSDGSDFEAVNRAQPLAFESEYFRGHVLVMVKDSTKSAEEGHKGNWTHLFGTKKRMLWVQIQGRFKRQLPSRAVMYLATELPEPDGFQVAFLTRQLVSLLISLVKKFVPMAHIAFGKKATTGEDSELPHAAFPLYQTVDEFVVTDASDTEKTPTFGQEVFGESADEKKRRTSTPVGMEPAVRMDAVYSFQFYTMYSDLAQWRIVNVPGMPDMELKRFCGAQPIRLSVYAMTTPALHPGILCDLPHRTKDKEYIFCFSMHHNPSLQSKQLADAEENGIKSPLLPPTSSNAPPAGPTSPFRCRSVSCDQPESIVRQQRRDVDAGQTKEERISDVTAVEQKPQPRIRASSSVRNMTSFERAANLSNWRFSLPVWVERVDPAAGIRKVAYLFVVEERHTTSSTRRCVVRSAHTVKNALLLLDASNMGPLTREFKKLVVESREFLYETISRETDQVAQALQAIAATPAEEASDSDEAKKAMLFNCLMSQSQLPCIRAYQDIGVQLTKAKRDQMDIIFEEGIYRMHDPRFLRQEWFIVTTSDLLFYRSFTLKPSKIIQLSQVLGVRTMDDVPFFDRVLSSETDGVMETSSPRQRVRDMAMKSTNQWFCAEIHVLNEIVTVFFDSASSRALCVSSLIQLIKLKSGGSAIRGLERLPPIRSIDSITVPVCCNQRRLLPVSRVGQKRNPLMVAEQMVERGLQLYRLPRHEVVAAEVVAFLDAVEQLSEIDLQTGMPSTVESTGGAENALVGPEQWFITRESRLAFALNLFHGLFIHTWLVFGDVRSHAQWKKMKTMVYYTIGDSRSPSTQLHLSLGDIEHVVLQGRYAHGEEHRSMVSPGKLPLFLVPQQRDFRTIFALQTNSSSVSTQPLRVYHAASLSSELDATCAAYLEREVVVDDVHRVIQLPKICEWNIDDFVKKSPVVQPGSRAFFCLQKLLPLMHQHQHDRIQHVLLGAGKEYQIRFNAQFWVQDLKQTPKSSDAPRAVPTESTENTNTRTKDDLTVASASVRIAETNDCIPRSKSALQFIQSLF